MADRDPAVLGGYEVRNVIARGGMAVVYRAFDPAAGREIAVKRILPEAAEDPEFLDRFKHEVRIHSQLSHPNVLSLFGFGVAAEGSFIAMELADGGSLRDLLDRAGPLPPEAVLFLGREVLRGLAAAHTQGVVHRDMKPQNVLLTRDGGVKVADFGISKTAQMTRLTQTGSVVGTPSYMSPEQALARPLGPASDLFSTGVMLYECLAGRNPFETDNPATTLRQILDLVPPSLFAVDPTIPAEVELLLDRLLAKDAARRPPSAEAAARETDALLATLSDGPPAEAFRKLLADPGLAVEVRAEKLSQRHLERARALLASGQASDEVLLWEAFLAHRHGPGNGEASALLSDLARRAGYRVGALPPSPKIAELEARLARDPDSPGLLLQLAKLSRLERDFVRTMRFFLRLRALPIEDPYVRTQVASLVARPDRDGHPVPEPPPGPAPAPGAAPSPLPVARQGAPLAAPSAAPVAPRPAPAPAPRPAPARGPRTVLMPEKSPTRKLPASTGRGRLLVLALLAAAAVLAGLLTFLR
ncbi:MAG: serine/threonine protein kinase [Acidobacteria bacterium]|nr:MAG: serine/threonine protein kinase [Acidobacteriota bacterium]